MSQCFSPDLSSLSNYGGETSGRSFTPSVKTPSVKDDNGADKLAFFPESSSGCRTEISFLENRQTSHRQDPFPKWKHWSAYPSDHSCDLSEGTLYTHQILTYDHIEVPGSPLFSLELESLEQGSSDCLDETTWTEAETFSSRHLPDQTKKDKTVSRPQNHEDVKGSGSTLITEEGRDNTNENLDYMLFEQAFVVSKMLGSNIRLDPILTRDLNSIVETHRSFLLAMPQHCKKDCKLSSDPLNCCWMTKYEESRIGPKQVFQRDLTCCVLECANRNGINICSLPEHCESYLREWAQLHSTNPYMTKITLSETAHTLGLQVKQVTNWLENWRARKWSPLSADQKGRKGKYCRHFQDDTNEVKGWMLKMGRYPTKAEAQDLSKDLNMNSNEIQTWCKNFRKRNKHLFPAWKSNCGRPRKIVGKKRKDVHHSPHLFSQEGADHRLEMKEC